MTHRTDGSGQVHDPTGKWDYPEVDVAALYDGLSEPAGAASNDVPDDADARPVNVFERSWRPVDLTPVLDRTWTPISATVGARTDGQAVLYPGRVHTLASETEAGKTWLALSLARDELDAGNHVVYLDFEDDEGGIAGRLLAIGTARDTIRNRFHYLRPATALGTGIHRDDLHAVLDQGPTLVILDGITAAMTLHGFDVISNRDVAAFAQILPATIAATGPAVLLLDHVTKSSETRGRYALGAVHKLNGVTGASLLLDVVAPIRIGSTGRSRIRIAKDRPADLRRHALPSLDGTGLDWFADLVVESHGDDFVEVTIEPPNPRVASPARKRPTVYMKRVSDVLEGVAVPLSQRDILARVTGNASHIRSAIAAMVDEEFIRTSAGPRGAVLHALERRFEEETT